MSTGQPGKEYSSAGAIAPARSGRRQEWEASAATEKSEDFYECLPESVQRAIDNQLKPAVAQNTYTEIYYQIITALQLAILRTKSA